MIPTPALFQSLVHQLEALFRDTDAPTVSLRAERHAEITHDAGISLPQYHQLQPGSPVYLPAKYH
ncbi:hypothetical protein QWZ03_19245 [Chitinimonas viridis]|uniref:Uncharacterized protein n=1 Tax=Chitinimonas viridis TaxID=664880 RepID=A0ABT8BAY8_9NEIS|nr:hypothetical protein [Chitinimonas viridis]MDN3578907.1 hypothetical protein [Chitinimonas viridis]